jgi:2-polyprenyl-3-methyl-5-hydroxy-6-metoxy-1,4-benzoquinol methylase
MNQQRQAHDYFRSSANDWQRKSENASREYSVIEFRNAAVLTVLRAMPKRGRFLDVGCGTGQLVLAAAQLGFDSTGMDFSEEMIAQCALNRRTSGVAANFICASFFDLPVMDRHYDVISAQGFIEYISPEQLDDFFHVSGRMLRSGGNVVVGSRNRLYNVLSLNEFTEIEMRLGTLNALVAEAIALQASTSQEAAFAALANCERSYPHPQAHPSTGISVDLRYQYSPADLVGRLRNHGFLPRTLFPIHYHGLPPAVKTEHLGVHSELAHIMQELAPTDPRLVPYCSSFSLHAQRNE